MRTQARVRAETGLGLRSKDVGFSHESCVNSTLQQKFVPSMSCSESLSLQSLELGRRIYAGARERAEHGLGFRGED
jgi:hypothetical protein